ncbi:MAG: RidA family protein [Dehalococcoidia bacterium]|jgi:enamine deaminase RidA (YjgF/YER057c/UK114 family)|nr:RidA family protein [Dehalococcoidia bacterium]MBT7098912.1 RidA family protein [Candidatus Poribacteria bacterium]
MSQLSHVDPPGLFPGAPYHYGTITAPGAMLFTAGACPLDAEGRIVDLDDRPAQARVALDNLDAVLTEAGASYEGLIRTTVYVVGTPDDLVEVWDVVAARFAPHQPPSTLLGVAALGYPGQLVEIDAIAALPNQV